MLLVVIMRGMYIVCVYVYVFLLFVWHHITQCSYEANVSCPNDSWIFFWFKHNSNKRKGKQSVGYKLLYGASSIWSGNNSHRNDLAVHKLELLEIKYLIDSRDPGTCPLISIH